MSDIENKFINLIKITKSLRSENGCPWDKKQTFESLRTYIIEEAYEVIDAIQDKNFSNLTEETGDLLLQILFISNIAEEENLFTLEDVVSVLSSKLIRRHPHVFGDKNVKDDKEALELWNKQKALEKKGLKKEVSKVLPSLARAVEISKEFSKQGLDFPSEDDVLTKLESEIKEFEDVRFGSNKVDIEEELGDILFTVANLCRIKSINPEIALNRSTDKFNKRAKIFLKQKAKGESNTTAWEKAKLQVKKT